MIKQTPLLLLLMLLWACKPHESSGTEKPVISVSILPQQYFIEQLAGDLVEVNVMIPPGASPATYEPTVSQLGKLDHSEVYLKIGYVGFELGWMDKIKSVNPSMEVIDLSIGIDLIQGAGLDDHSHEGLHDHGGTDPHIWMSPGNAKIIASNICHSLIKILPDKRDILAANLALFTSKLDSLDGEIESMLAGLEQRKFMIFHPSLTYFARDYNLEQLPLEFEGKEPSPHHMAKMTDLGREFHISTIFLQKQFDEKNARTLANEIEAEVVQIDPLDPDWYHQILFIAEKLKQSL
jgi:zinc transport system substrate-binding protein